MKCPKCGTEQNIGKYCGYCGYDFSSIYKEEKDKKVKKTVLVILALVIGFIIVNVGLILFIFFVITKSLKDIEKKEYVEHDDIRVMTIYGVTNEQLKVCSYSTKNNTSNSSLEIRFCSSIPENVREEYIDYLTEEKYSELEENVYIKVDNGCPISITVTSDEVKYDICGGEL